MKKVNILIPAAGEGSRFRNVGWHKPKPLIDVAGKPMIQIVQNNVKWCPVIPHDYICIVRRDSPPMPFECKTVVCDQLTEGAACTTLLAKDLIDNDHPLLIANSDQFLEWNRSQFWVKVLGDTSSDGTVVCFEHPMELNDTKWSYARIDEETKDVLEIQEKKVISPYATTGMYFWRRGKDYVKYAEQMIAKNIRVNNEFYVAPVYNEAIQDGLKFKLHFCDKFWGLGTPADLTKFLCDYIRPRAFPVKLIAHRGNTRGPNPDEENKPEYLQKALAQGYDVETDVWYKDGEYYLGHDEPQYKTTVEFLSQFCLWKHCKTPETLSRLWQDFSVSGHCFFHQEDDVTLTTIHGLWFYPDKPTFGPDAVAVLPTNPHKMMRDNPKLMGLCLDDMSQVLATKIKAVVFDLDGVLVDSRDMHYEALNEALAKVAGEEFVISRAEHETTYDGLSTQQKLELLVTEKKLDPELKRKIFDLKQQGTIERFKTTTTNKPDPEMRDTLQEWKRRGFPIGVASNCIRSSVVALLEALGILDQVDVIFSNEDVSNPKPDPEIYLKAAAAFGVTPQEIFVIEDSLRGIRAARAAGARVYVVDSPRDVRGKFNEMYESACLGPVATGDLHQIHKEMRERNLKAFQVERPVYDVLKDHRRCCAIYCLTNRSNWFPTQKLTNELMGWRECSTITYDANHNLTPSARRLIDSGCAMHGTLHFTLMQLLGFSDQPGREFKGDPAKLVDLVQRYLPAFQIHFHTFAVTPKTIAILGTPTADINLVREKIRQEFGAVLDEPYKNNVVHMTIARFINGQNWSTTEDLVDLATAPSEPLGVLHVDQLIMSRASWRMLPEELQPYSRLIIPLH